MELYLVRHTTPNIEKGICYGQSDIGVTDTFTEEVKKIHEQIPIGTITRVYSSPLQRCRLLAKTFSREIILDKRLKELNFGDWELQSWDTIPSEQLTPWMKDFVHVKVPFGESYTMLQDRVLDFYHSLDFQSDEKIVVVSHAGPIRALLAHLQNIPLKDSFDIKIAYSEVFRI